MSAAEARPGDADLDQTVLNAAFARETRRGVALALIGRLALFGLLWLSFYLDAKGRLDNPYFLYRSGLMALALASGLVNFLVTRRSPRPVFWASAFFLLDAVTLGALTFGWLPPAIVDYPQFLAVRLQDAMIFAAVVATTVFPLSGRLSAWGTSGVVVVWLTGIAVSFMRTPGAVTDVAARQGAKTWPALLARVSRPEVLSIPYLIIQVTALACLGALLWLGINRARANVADAVNAEGRIAALRRFFAPELADLVTASRGSVLPSRRGQVAVLFADIESGGDLARLQAWYAVVEPRVFEHAGLIDRFVGDPVMAAFGVDIGDGSATDPARAAFACAEALLDDLKRANLVGVVGLHVGEALSGEVGSYRHRAFGVVGDTVNVTRRLMDLARARRVSLMASDTFVRASGAELRPAGSVMLRGQAEPLEVWER